MNPRRRQEGILKRYTKAVENVMTARSGGGEREKSRRRMQMLKGTLREANGVVPVYESEVAKDAT
jgi:hypothetical protein